MDRNIIMLAKSNTIRVLVMVVWLSVLLCGCQGDFKADKEAAVKRWNSSRSEMTMRLARQEFDTGDFGKALQNVQTAAALNPDEPGLDFLRGRIHLEQNHLRQARASFENCLSKEAGNHQAYYYLGIIAERENDLREAFNCYRAALSADPDNASYLRALAETLAHLDQHEQVIRLVDSHLAGGGQDAGLMMLAGQSLSLQKEYKRAALMFDQARMVNPDDMLAAESSAVAHYRAGEYEQARAGFESLECLAVAQGRQLNVGCELARGDCLAALGQYREARQCYEKIRSEQGEKQYLWTRLGQTALARGDLKQARDYAKYCLAQDHSDNDALLLLGYTALRQKDYQLARRALETLVDRNDDGALAWYLLAQAQQGLGDKVAARNSYNQALKLEPGMAIAQQGLRQSGNVRQY